METLCVLLYLTLVGVLDGLLVVWLFRRGVRRWILFVLGVIILGALPLPLPQIMHAMGQHGSAVRVLFGGAEGWREYLLALILGFFQYGSCIFVLMFLAPDLWRKKTGQLQPIIGSD
jgi:hypothetical protein